MIEIKELTIELLRQYHESIMNSYDALVPSSNSDIDKILEYFLEMKKQSTMVFIALDISLNQVVGMATTLIEYKITRGGVKAGHIEEVAVSKKAQGQGVGTKLINACLKFCAQEGCYKTILDCDNENAGYYERFGFKNKGAFMCKYN